jgi:methyl-accepting chemotaxis protein
MAHLFLFKLPRTRVEQAFYGPAFFSNLVWAILALVVVACVRSVFVSHKIVGPMLRLKDIMQSVGGGDLTYHVRFRTRDRFKGIGEACDGMIAGLRDLVSADRTSAAQISELAKRAGAILNGGELSSERVQQVRASLEEIISKAERITIAYKVE